MADDRFNRFKSLHPVKATEPMSIRIDLSKSRKYESDKQKQLGTLPLTRLVKCSDVRNDTYVPQGVVHRSSTERQSVTSERRSTKKFTKVKKEIRSGRTVCK